MLHEKCGGSVVEIEGLGVWTLPEALYCVLRVGSYAVFVWIHCTDVRIQ